MIATKTIVLHTDNSFIAEVFEGESYMIPETVNIFDGTKEDFFILNPDFKEQDKIDEFDSYEEIL
jgi:hypothetical protein